METETFHLKRGEQALLLKIARETLNHYLNTGKILDYDDEMLTDNIKQHYGVFVTLHKGKALRGCIGHFESDKPLYKAVQQMVISSAMRDPRFKPLKYGELPQIDIEISVLSPMKKVASIDEIELGKHGIYIKKDHHTGTFLPQVAVETGWDLNEFLGHCARDKAGIGWDGWRDAELFIYTAEIFNEKEMKL